jgi:hypothetical protein
MIRTLEAGDVGFFYRPRRGVSKYIVAVRNPAAPAPSGAGLPRQRRPKLPPKLRERFDGRRWNVVDDPAFLDHEGVELVLIGAAEDVEAELGIELDANAERLEAAELVANLLDRSGASVDAGR